MLRRHKLPSPPPSAQHSPIEPSPHSPSALGECETVLDTEDDEAMSAEDIIPPSRPLSLAIPAHDLQSSGPYCPRRPNLADILSNTAAPPWTLSAFMAYLSQNHCLETLEFTMDAARYRKHYNKAVNQQEDGQIQPDSQACRHLCMLWQRLLEAYIFPDGEREVNIPSDIRDSLLTSSNPHLPPHPLKLDAAVHKVYELMEESVLYPFLNAYAPESAKTFSEASDASEENLHSGLSHHSHRSPFHTGPRRRTSPSPVSAVEPYSATASVPLGASHALRHVSAPMPTSAASHSFTTPLKRLSPAPPRTTYANSVSSTSSCLSSDVVMNAGSLKLVPPVIDDERSSNDPSTADSPPRSGSADLMTPPTTPPTSDSAGRVSPPISATGGSPRGTRDQNAWKKMSGSLRTLMGKKERIREDDGEAMDLD